MCSPNEPQPADTPASAAQIRQERHADIAIKIVATPKTGPDPLIAVLGDMLLAEWWSQHAPQLYRPALTTHDPAAKTRPPVAAQDEKVA